jgi:hypothetical protein
LCFVNRKEPINGFKLDDDPILHDEIEALTAVDQHPLVCERQWPLAVMA